MEEDVMRPAKNEKVIRSFLADTLIIVVMNFKRRCYSTYLASVSSSR
jgi:hypothetical protein